MELMIAWFPALKLGIGILVLVALYFLFTRGWIKSGIVLTILLAIFTMLNPIAYDGTNSIEASVENIRLVDEKLELAHEEHPVAIITPIISFDEQMKIQQAASDARTAKMREDMGLD